MRVIPKVGRDKFESDSFDRQSSHTRTIQNLKCGRGLCVCVRVFSRYNSDKLDES